MSERPELPNLNIDIDRLGFIRDTVPALIRSLPGDRKPLWGTMTVQHMVEHLAFINENTLGRREVPLLISEDKLPKYKTFLMSAKGFMRNFKFPMLPQEGLVPLRHASLAEAVEALLDTNREFVELVSDPHFALVPHPFYGRMDREEAIMFHFKHYMHHLMQFGLENA